MKWTQEEDMLIVCLFKKYQTRWSEIAKHVPGRSDNQIKNRYNSNLKKRIEDGSIDALLNEAMQPTTKTESDESMKDACSTTPQTLTE